MAVSASIQLLLAATMTAPLGVSYHVTCPPCACGLPTYDYQSLTTSRLVQAVSMPMVEIRLEQRTRFSPGLPPDGLTTAAPLVLRERVRYFQLEQSQLKVDHCSLPRFVLVLHEDGYWTLSLRADQNPETEGQPFNAVTAPGVPLSDTIKQTTQLKRNLFSVRVLCHTGFPLDENLPQTGTGKPVLFEVRPEPFWVQRGQPRDVWIKQAQEDVSKYFDLIDRVQVEFSYR
jgi:hypothetical protein